jgi:NAD(P)-dependent dehydrogenase (short-subunit alcohol dehydrogenase family)
VTGVLAMLGRGVDTVLDRTVIGGYPRWGLLLRRRLPGWPADVPDHAMADRTAVVTGASSGLGAATVAELARLGAIVHMVVRDTGKGERVRDELTARVPGARLRVWRCDVSDLDDVTRFARALGDETGVDVLVHNAGLLPPERTTSAQGHELALATHVLGPLRMTELLRPALRPGGARVIWVSSGGMYAQRLPAADPEYTTGRFRGASAYARTKRIQVSLVPPLATRWAADGIAVYATHPGWADTPGVAESLPGFHRLTGPILRDADEGADTTVWLAATNPAPSTGLLWHDRRPRGAHLVPWTRHDERAGADMLAWCARAAGVAP